MAMRSADENTALRGAALGALTPATVRHRFVQKVYGILTAQLFLTMGLGGFIMVSAKDLVEKNKPLALSLLVGSLALNIVLLCAFACCPQILRKAPTNYILLGLFTATESVLVGMICASYTGESVLIAIGITLLVVSALTLFECRTSIDFTGCGPYLFVFAVVLLGFGLILSIVIWCVPNPGPAFGALRLVYAAVGALLFSLYLVYDTQLIIGGKHNKHQFELDDYCFAALNLYIDIVQLFLFLLEIFGSRA